MKRINNLIFKNDLKKTITYKSLIAKIGIPIFLGFSLYHYGFRSIINLESNLKINYFKYTDNINAVQIHSNSPIEDKINYKHIEKINGEAIVVLDGHGGSFFG